MKKITLAAIYTLLLMGVTSAQSICGRWSHIDEVDEYSFTFGVDGTLEVTESETSYTATYEFDGALFTKIMVIGGIEFKDYYYLYFGEDRKSFGLVIYDDVYFNTMEEFWDPEMMSFSTVVGARHFERYRADFEASGDDMEEWFEIFVQR
ncbi:MAG: hypothetical protein SNF68_08000 [Rikenellaceae bacterium]